jgi:C1A family cysteine protease
VGYDLATERFTVANSWGTGWGQSGFFTIPFAYLTNTDLAEDFWMVMA